MRLSLSFLTADISGVPFVEVTIDGKQFLKGPAVILKHGVHNGGFWPLDEMKATLAEWTGTDMVINHPPSYGYRAWDAYLKNGHIGHLADPEIVADGIKTAAGDAAGAERLNNRFQGIRADLEAYDRSCRDLRT